MSGISQFKKQPTMASREFSRMFSQISKASLIDTLWCACQLGTNESDEEITTQAARNAVIALETRGNRVPADIRKQSQERIDADV